MKNVITTAMFFCVVMVLIFLINPLFVDKVNNRYYMLSNELEQIEKIDVQIYGSCHAYTSFDSEEFSNKTGLYSYNMSNPSEIIPVTYLRVKERLKRDIPKAVVIETWGLNAYETHIKSDEILTVYMKLNLEDVPLSLDKISVIKNYSFLNMIEENFYIAKYKERLLNFSINELDFNYSFELAKSKAETDVITQAVLKEMQNRFKHNGFKLNSSKNLSDYPKQQANVQKDEILPVEEDLMAYVEKIIELCEEKDVPLIFYRAPYRSKENELRKVNYLEQYFKERGIPFYDLEKEIEYNYRMDFNDYEHLSKSGAKKSTDFLTKKILEEIK